MKLIRRGLRVTLLCDGMKSRTGRRFTDCFPHMAGRTIKFHSWEAVEMVDKAEIWAWLVRENYL